MEQLLVLGVLTVVLILLSIRWKVARVGLLVVLTPLALVANGKFMKASLLSNNMKGRGAYSLCTGREGRHVVTIDALPGVEGIHVSIIPRRGTERPTFPLNTFNLRSVAWKLSQLPEGTEVSWFELAGRAMAQPDDGIPLFEVGGLASKRSLVLEYTVSEETRPFLENAEFLVRPDWFSLKMCPGVSDIERSIGACYVVGVILTSIMLAWHLIRRDGKDCQHRASHR